MRLTFWTALIAFLVDQASKYYILHILRLDTIGRVEVVPPYLNFVMAWNEGVNFGILHGTGRWLLIALALGISAGIALWVRRGGLRPIALVGAGLLIGGALGNVVDRIIYGGVADFLNMSCCGIRNPYSFNVADIFVFAGAFALILFTGKEKASPTARDKTP